MVSTILSIPIPKICLHSFPNTLMYFYRQFEILLGLNTDLYMEMYVLTYIMTAALFPKCSLAE